MRSVSTFTSVSLVTAIGLAGGIWLGQGAIAPQIAQAYTARATIALDQQSDETFETLIHRAELAARTAAQRSFDTDVLIADVVITITGESQGLVVPILTLQVNRPQWKNRPDPKFWSTYFRDARDLLGLRQ
ncbi:MAG: hypothetical protein F6K19_20745 [Cyanothece sp. SIO1E1]|nr:hypothetical protein [Cyanothece sp. SIO1E1]